jgi:hypothetical protein
MKDPQTYSIVLFKSLSHALLAEKILKEAHIPHKLIPVPRHISADCGVCLRFASDMLDPIEHALMGRVEINRITSL